MTTQLRIVCQYAIEDVLTALVEVHWVRRVKVPMPQMSELDGQINSKDTKKQNCVILVGEKNIVSICRCFIIPEFSGRRRRDGTFTTYKFK
jgi:hypothetical protein